MNDDFMFQLFGKYKDLADAVKHPCHLNMAACMLRLNRYEEAIAQCSVVCGNLPQLCIHKVLMLRMLCIRI